jgi:transposase InsO family protein
VPEWFHSDQGSEYASNRVQSFLESRGVTISMNPKSSPWCNGSQESFFGRFKVEFGEFDRFETYAELLEELYQQLSYFTFERIKTKLRISPAEFRQEWIARQSQFATTIHSYSQVMSLPHAPSRPCGAEEQPLLLIA